MDLGGFFNSLTSPVGVKLFSGGPYADAGAGDKMQGNLDKLMAQLAPIIAQIAQSAGVGNPLNGEGQIPGGDPYSLSPQQQAGLNREESLTAEEYNQILGKVKANLTSRGMGDSSTMQAAEVYLKQQMATQMGGERLQAGQNAYGNRMNALQQISQMLGQQFGAQQQVTQQQGQTAVASHQEAMQQIGSLIALGMYGAGAGPFAAAKGGGVPVGGLGNQSRSETGINPSTNAGVMPIDPTGGFNWGSIYH